jgi:superfamily II DNA or RNA helicase
MKPSAPGSFEYLESKIRRDAEGTLFGRDFEWVCQWYLEHAPLYRGKFRRVWRWADWPDRWGPDCGIDLIAETHDGKLWAIQAKAVAPAHTITKAEIDSFLSESNRREIAFRLLIATTDKIGSNARRTIDQQAKHASIVGRGDLLAADIAWPTKIGGKAPRPKRAKPRPHQRAAIAATVRGFRQHPRGRLIMACGTGKTLTGLWIHERLKSRRTLLLVPSISLVQQNLREWGRHAKEDFDFLVVCSDESVASDREDPALRYIAELGIDVTTDPREIAAFLAKRRRRPAVVISTYQSSDRVSAGQRGAKKTFDLALCDEAHRLVGDMRGKFATVLDDRKIRCRRRLFMTATPRYFTQRARQRAADQDLEVASMDDPETFGPEFHVLKFFDAITAKPTPLLTDYRVVVIGVTNAEAARWVEEGKLVRTREGAETDARTLAARIGLAKAMREYDLRRVITFHRSIRRASRFVDADRRDSLPAIVKTLRPASRPTGKLWARHISGETPASKRASMLRALAELPSNTRGLIANCACLGEGVDVPALDGIAFIDPKGSMVDIIQAVGRVIRLSPDKTVGTIVIPVFIDESSDVEHALEQSAFDPVWQVLKALRAHDQRLADELDTLRLAFGKLSGGRVQLPVNVVLDVPMVAIRDFEQAFYVQAVKRVTERPRLTIDQILHWADQHRDNTGHWPTEKAGNIEGTNEDWRNIRAALALGLRGLPGGSSLAKLLHEERGYRCHLMAEPLKLSDILRWADDYRLANGVWPTRHSGLIPNTEETWGRIDNALKEGLRSLPGEQSLASILVKHRNARTRLSLPRLSVKRILEWADSHRQHHGEWPTQNSGRIEGTGENWATVSAAATNGLRGMRTKKSLAQILQKYRSRKNQSHRPRLSYDQIIGWADAFFARHAAWPSASSGPIEGCDDTWRAVAVALQKGLRGLPRGTSLAQLLEQERGVRNIANLPLLSNKQILVWADQYKKKYGRWPSARSGAIEGSVDTWATVNRALVSGSRGLRDSTTLAELLINYRGSRSVSSLPKLSQQQILIWADGHKELTGDWPTTKSDWVLADDESWRSVDNALRLGLRGLAGNSSLAKLLARYRGRRHKHMMPRLTIARILALAKRHRRATGTWPTTTSGAISDEQESWANIDNALRVGLRGLPGGSSLAKALDKYLRRLD